MMLVPLSKTQVQAAGQALYQVGKRPPVTWTPSIGSMPTILAWWTENPNEKEPSGLWKKAGIRTYLVCSSLAENSARISTSYVTDDAHPFWPDRAVIKTALRAGFIEPIETDAGILDGFELTESGQQWIEE